MHHCNLTDDEIIRETECDPTATVRELELADRLSRAMENIESLESEVVKQASPAVKLNDLLEVDSE